MSQHPEVKILSNAVNCPVLHFPGRRFPGVLIQGDSLKVLLDSTAEILKQLDSGEFEEASACAEGLHGLLTGYLTTYEETLRSLRLELPYPIKGQ